MDAASTRRPPKALADANRFWKHVPPCGGPHQNRCTPSNRQRHRIATASRRSPATPAPAMSSHARTAATSCHDKQQPHLDVPPGLRSANRKAGGHTNARSRDADNCGPPAVASRHLIARGDYRSSDAGLEREGDVHCIGVAATRHILTAGDRAVDRHCARVRHQ